MKGKIAALVAIVAILLIGLYAADAVRSRQFEEAAQWQDDGVPDEVPAEAPPQDDRVTLEGKSTCLAHKDTTGPQTMECALGLTLDDGTSYALDVSAVTFESGFDIMSSKRVRVSGKLVPIEAVSADSWRAYDIRGILSVESIVAI